MTVRRRPHWGTILRVVLFLGVGANTYGASGCVGDLPPRSGETVWFGDFETGWGDWYAENGVWQIGAPTSGPNGAHQGKSVAATVLSGNYPFSTDSRLVSPPIVLPSLLPGETLELRFWHWFSYAAGCPDNGRVEIRTYDPNGWSAWTSLGVSATEQSAGWSRATKDLTMYAGKVIEVGFYHDDVFEDPGWPRHSESTGWYIDEVEIWRGVPHFVSVEGFESGWGDWYADNGLWQIGKPTKGPSGAFSGEAVAGTNLSGDYPPYTDSRLISPPLVLPSASELLPGEVIELRFYQWFSYASTCLDHGRVEVQTLEPTGWSVWKSLGVSADEISAGWSRAAKDLTQYAGKLVRVAFCHDETYDDPGWPRHYESTGWYIDEVEIWHGMPQSANPEGFELGWGDWSADNGVWQIGKPTSGPGAAHSGEYVAATNLSGNYPFNADSRLVMPPATLPKFSQLPPGQVLELRFWQWFSYTDNSGDHGRVEIQTLEVTGWSSWKSLGVSASGTSGGWSRTAKDLTKYAGQTIRIGFYHDDVFEDPGWPRHYESTGWYIDDVEITGLGPVLTSWSAGGDTGFNLMDKLTSDTTPDLTFVFSRPVAGTNNDIQVLDPNGNAVVAGSITGWGTATVVARFTTPWVRQGRYTIVLKSTMTDAQGRAFNAGTSKVLHLTLDPASPKVNDPGNLIRNGGFEEGTNPPAKEQPVVTLHIGAREVAWWQVDSNNVDWTHESRLPDAGPGERFVDFHGTKASKGAVSQTIPTVPGMVYYVWFDLVADPHGITGTRTVLLSVAGADKPGPDAPAEFRCAAGAQAGWQRKACSFTAMGKSTTLTFAGENDPTTEFSVAIDNIVVLPSRPPDPLTVEITDVDTSKCPTIQAKVSVTDKKGATPDGLNVASSFSVYEDGHLRTPITVKPSGSAISVCLALDYSGSMLKEGDPNAPIRLMEEGAKRFVSLMNLRPGGTGVLDRGEIIKFATDVEVMQMFTDDRLLLEKAIGRRMTKWEPSDTNLYDAIYQGISDAAGQPNNRAVVVMTDGKNTGSKHRIDEVIEYARTKKVPVYTIGLYNKNEDGSYTLKDADEDTLKRIAAETGGLYEKAPDADQLKGIYEKVAGILKNQYVVTYDSVACVAANASQTPHTLEIRVVAGAAQGEGTKTFPCPVTCKR